MIPINHDRHLLTDKKGTSIQNVSIAITGNMSCENSTWINPCGLTTDEVDADFDNTSIDDLNKRIVGSAEVFSSQLNELRNYMIKTFPDIDEESLISHEFSFLKTPEKITDIYADSFGMLQKCAMALDVLKEESNESHMNEYDNMLKRLRGKLQEMLCCEHLILKIKSIPFNDVEVRVMDRAFRRNGAKEGNMIKHIIALRQIEKPFKRHIQKVVGGLIFDVCGQDLAKGKMWTLDIPDVH
ncbi:hypothetical protein CDAR_228601 [Caerostris darwini]|uniref:Uncharacterized protein n=1 Tax=Caerostris darwini TaxID=1538125 RepID=A0AAV4N3M5_9ARAC|nr:hypothetical protein CDAR_228601 [Caerostris darwini]